MVKKALLIGIEYRNTNKELKGTKNDVKLIKNMLIKDHGFEDKNIIELLESNNGYEPTAENIISNLKHLANILTPNDFFVLQYSGHGQYIIDKNMDEVDGFDEAIVPLDYRKSGIITDDSINDILSTFKCKTFILFDTCYSGTMCDLPYTWDIDNGYKCITNKKNIMNNKNIIKLASSLDREESFTIMSDRLMYVGAFTNAFYLSMKTNKNTNLDFMSLVEHINKRITIKGLKQHSVIESSNKLAAYVYVNTFLEKQTTHDVVTKEVIDNQSITINKLQEQLNAYKSNTLTLQNEIDTLTNKKDQLLIENKELKSLVNTFEQKFKQFYSIPKKIPKNIDYIKKNKKSFILSQQK
jgi:hypothetical protein